MLTPQEVEYLQAYLALCEDAFSEEDPALLVIREFDDKDETGEYVTFEEENEYLEKLADLNVKARANGISDAVIREQFIGHEALEISGAWYSSTAYCEMMNG